MRTLIVGLDAFDPTLFERLSDNGRLPNLSRYTRSDGYRRLQVADPPQSEVSWTSIATGLDPGGHGMFDFVHRVPASYAAYPSLLPTERGLTGRRFVRPFRAETIFDAAVEQGYPSTALWWPALFPADRGSPVRAIPGLGTPDILGRLGVGVAFTTDLAQAGHQPGKIPIAPLTDSGGGRYRGSFEGPRRKSGAPATADFSLEIDGSDVTLLCSGRRLHFAVGSWSPIFQITFKMGRLLRVRAITRIIVTAAGPTLSMYALPLQIDPNHPLWPYATPRRFVRDAWRQGGFLTLGWPQDTTALEEGYIDDAQFLDLCAQISAERERVLLYHLDSFDEGILACVFDSLDRVQHMFLDRRPDIVADWYERCDRLVDRIDQRLGAGRAARLLVLSDHGFAPFDFKVHVNRRLIDSGWMASQSPSSPDLAPVAWGETQAYAVGLNSLYLNLTGREGQGTVAPAQSAALIERLCRELEQWRGPDGRRVVQRARPGREAFSGPHVAHGPDLLIGFNPGYRASQVNGLGGWEAAAIERNDDVWHADHCISADAVPGVVFSNAPLPANVSFRDIPQLALGRPLSGRVDDAPPPLDDSDTERLAERLRGLGYL